MRVGLVRVELSLNALELLDRYDGLVLAGVGLALVDNLPDVLAVDQ